MAVVSVWVGAPSTSGAVVVTKVDSSADVRVAVSEDAAITSPDFFGPVTPDAQNVARVEIAGLDAGQVYHFAVEHDGTLDEDLPGRLRTLPASPTEIVIGHASCAGSNPLTEGVGTVLAADRLSNDRVFDTIRSQAVTEGWDLFVHMGDLHYYDLGSGSHGIAGGASLANYRAGYDDVLTQPRQHELYRTVPTAYVWDDHDYGPDNSDRTHTGRANAQQVYRERVPHFPLPDSDAIYQSWRIGRVLCVLSDVRSDRDPNSDPQTSSKTLLGSAQRVWLEDLLASTDAEFFVWLLPERAWQEESASDSWASFTHERAELVTLFRESGWAERMLIVDGDFHYIGIDSGSHDYGGMPVFQAAALDCSTASPPNEDMWDVGVSEARRQYGVTRIVDGGDTFTVTLTGYADGQVVLTHTFAVDLTEATAPQPGTGLAQVAQAQIRSRVTWLSCDLASGQVITELPDLQGDEVSRVIGEYTSANLGLPIPAVGGRDLKLAQRAALAVQSTEPARTMIVPVVNDIPTAGFIPLTRDRGTDATVHLGCVSLEGYLRHRYVRDHLWEGVDPAEIAIGLFADAEDIDGNGQGLNLIVDAPDVNLTAGRYYQATDDETVYGALSELMDAGLLEWTIDVDWRDGLAYRVVDKIARVRLRLGLSGQPTAVFQSAAFSSEGASDARYTLKAEHGGDRYGNWIVARGTGEGEDQPRSSAEIDQGALDTGAPIWEQRIQPDIYRSPLFTEEQFNSYVQEQLELHAQQELARIRGGSEALEITARWDAPGARYGIDWQLGDDVLHELKGHAHPDGFDGMKRAIGFALSIQAGTIRPILQEEF